MRSNWTRELDACNWSQKAAWELEPDESTVSGSAGTSGLPPGAQSTSARQEAPEESCRRRPSLVAAVARTHAKWILINSLISFFAVSPFVRCKSAALGQPDWPMRPATDWLMVLAGA